MTPHSRLRVLRVGSWRTCSLPGWGGRAAAAACTPGGRTPADARLPRRRLPSATGRSRAGQVPVGNKNVIQVCSLENYPFPSGMCTLCLLSWIVYAVNLQRFIWTRYKGTAHSINLSLTTHFSLFVCVCVCVCGCIDNPATFTGLATFGVR